MPNEEQLRNVIKKLEEHEKRIKRLENPLTQKTPRKTTIKRTILDQVNELKAEGFFDNPRMVTEITEKLAEKGYHYPESSLTHPLQRAVRQGILGRLKKDDKWAYCKR